MEDTNPMNKQPETVTREYYDRAVLKLAEILVDESLLAESETETALKIAEERDELQAKLDDSVPLSIHTGIVKQLEDKEAEVVQYQVSAMAKSARQNAEVGTFLSATDLADMEMDNPIMLRTVIKHLSEHLDLTGATDYMPDDNQGLVEYARQLDFYMQDGTTAGAFK